MGPKRAVFSLRVVLALCCILAFVSYLPTNMVAARHLADTPPPKSSTIEEFLVTPTVLPVQPDENADLKAELLAFEHALNQGPEAVLALRDALSSAALDIVMDEIIAAEAQVAAKAATPLPVRRTITQEEELVNLEAQREQDAINRASALALLHDADEGQSQFKSATPATTSSVRRPAADLTVGSSCTYATIWAALAAAQPGDRLLLEGGRTFTENLSIPISVTLEGGYDGCASGVTDNTVIDGNKIGRVLDVAATLDVTLLNLDIVNGQTGSEGGGIRFAAGSGTGSLTLQNINIYHNAGYWGGGLWVGPNANVMGTNIEIYTNTATTYGGGVRLYGGTATFTDTNIYENTAPHGGGIYGSKVNDHLPALSLPSYADVYSNRALNGLGGGIYFTDGEVELADCSDIYSNKAANGGGAYLITSTLTLEGSCSEIENNNVTENGGGVYAQGSTINVINQAELRTNEAGTSGGGLYLDDSYFWGDAAFIRNNEAANFGGGVYATNGSSVDMDLGNENCIGTHCSVVATNESLGSNGYGGGIYANNSEVDLRNTFIEDNLSNLGGGIYVTGGSLELYNSLLAENDATGTGDGIRLYEATMTGNGNTLADNNYGGASDGTAFALFNAEMTLGCSIIWGHNTSIESSGTNTINVTYSDVQGNPFPGTGTIDVDPQFVNPSIDDYHLQSTSPTIDQCSSFTSMTSDFDNETRPIAQSSTTTTPYDMGADEFSAQRVGINNGGCTYGTISQAAAAAVDGDSIQVATGTFYESVIIEGRKTITITGGYDSACATPDSGTTVVDASISSVSRRVFDIDTTTVLLQSLDITGGNSNNGGGLRVQNGSQVTLDKASIHHNQANYGGGIYISSGSAVTLTDHSPVEYNTASTIGGGVRVYEGQFTSLDTYSDISHNSALDGGGIAAYASNVYLYDADMEANQATGPTGQGGAVLLSDSSTLTMSGNVYIYNQNEAYDGAGIYADHSHVYVDGNNLILRQNIAANDGGAIYLTESAMDFERGKVGDTITSYANEAIRGAGIYAVTSTVAFEGKIINNISSEGGAGLYALASTVNLTNAQVGGTAANEANQVTGTGYGAGLYLGQDTHATISNTLITSNTLQTIGSGAGLYIAGGSVVTLTNSRVERHRAGSTINGRGAGIYISDSSVTLNNTQILSNTSMRAGGGIRVYASESATLTLLNDSLVRNNTSLDEDGGGIAASGNTNITLIDADLRDNTAATDGGAVSVKGGTLNFAGGWTLRSNKATNNGGAVAATGNTTVNMQAQAYSLVYNNRAENFGGVFYLANTGDTTLTVEQSSVYIYANHSTFSGGAFYVDAGDLSIFGEANIDHNWASNDYGGAIYLGNGAALDLNPNNTGVPELWDNRANTGYGGAIYAGQDTTVHCNQAAFGRPGEGNLALSGSGGAIYLSGSTLESVNCTYHDNQAAIDGGAIAAYTSTLSLAADYATCDPITSECNNFAGNLADSDGNNTGYGGAIYNNEGYVDVQQAVFESNQASRGGALYVAPDGHAKLANTLFYSNTTSEAYGSAVRTSNAWITATHVTLANNTGGAAFSPSSSSAWVTNTIAWGNDMGFARTYVYTDCNIDQQSTVGIAIDPQFVDLTNGDLRLAATSPAINACATGKAVDLNGLERPISNGYDMGAYEFAYDVQLSPDHSGAAFEGDTITYTHWLTNTGGASDSFTLTAQSDQGWPVTVTPYTTTLAPDATTTVSVALTVPAGIISGTVDTTLVTATSMKGYPLSVQVTDTTQAFIPSYAIDVRVVGSGTVDLVPDQTSYLSGTVVQLTATPTTSWSFAGWSGDLNSTSNTENLTMTSDKVVTATFAPPLPTYTLTINVVGQGSVTRTPSQTDYISGTVVQLDAIPDTGWYFTGWSGDLSIVNTPVDLTMDANKNITATFSTTPPVTYTLATNTVGQGSVTRTPNQTDYISGTVVQLEAIPDTGWYFTGWSGDISIANTPVALTMDANKNITATFSTTPPTTYTLATNTVGQGSVTRTPSQTDYISGTVVQLEAIPDAGWYFIGWSGDISIANTPVDLIMDAKKNVTATFSMTPPPTYTLTTNTVGQGSIIRTPHQTTYISGTVVQLEAVPASGWEFSGWSGDLSTINSRVNLVMDADKSITATFSETGGEEYFIYLPIIAKKS